MHTHSISIAVQGSHIFAPIAAIPSLYPLRAMSHEVLFNPHMSKTVCDRSRAENATLILVLTHEEAFARRVTSVMNTWAQHLCAHQRVAFVTDAVPPDFDASKLSVLSVGSTAGFRRARLFERWRRAVLTAVGCCSPWAAEALPPWRWLFLVDDDTFVVPRNLARVLRRHDPRAPRFLADTQTRGCQPVCGGGGMALSAALARAVFSAHDALLAAPGSASGNGDDFFAAFLARQLHVAPRNVVEFLSQPPDFYPRYKTHKDPHRRRHFKPFSANATATFHYVTGEKAAKWARQLFAEGGAGESDEFCTMA